MVWKDYLELLLSMMMMGLSMNHLHIPTRTPLEKFVMCWQKLDHVFRPREQILPHTTMQPPAGPQLEASQCLPPGVMSKSILIFSMTLLEFTSYIALDFWFPALMESFRIQQKKNAKNWVMKQIETKVQNQDRVAFRMGVWISRLEQEKLKVVIKIARWGEARGVMRPQWIF